MSQALSIIIPTYNRAEKLAATLRDVTQQSMKDFDLWVIDQSSPEQAAKNATAVTNLQDPRLNYVHLPTPGLPNARNEGLRRVKGDIVLFLDDDVILLVPNFLAAHLAAFDDPKVGGVTGRHIERTVTINSKRTACYVSIGGRTIFNLFGTTRQPIGSCKGSNMSFRATAIAQVGGFDRNTHLLEDTDYSVRIAKAGWQLMFEPDAELVHLSAPEGGVRKPNSIETEYRRFSSTAYYVFKHRGILGVVPFVAIFTLIAVSRVLRYRSIKVLPGYLQAILHGIALAKSGPDQLIANAPTIPAPPRAILAS
jgi:GT2 family glycosyltransferase